MTAPADGRRSPEWPSGRSLLVGVMGDPIRHSLSPRLHNAAFDALGLDWVSVAFPVAAGDVAAAFAGIRALGIVGMSVTMPHKADAARLVDERTEVAKRVGAVNTVVRVGNRLVGDSTDGPGFVAALRRGPGFDPAGRRCLVVGAGGAGRAVVEALAAAGASEVAVVNRTASRAESAAALAGAAGRVATAAAAADADLVVNATPVGMADTEPGRDGGDDPATRAYTLDPADLHPGQVVAELLYHPPVTALLEAARQAGATPVNGLGMLVHQAALAVERWTGRPAPVEAMWAAVEPGPGPVTFAGGASP